MSVRFTSDVEKDNIEKQKTLWELHKGTNIVKVLRKARDMGWKDKKIQVRLDKDTLQYYIEPYEESCGCRGILRYQDFFD